MTLSNTDQAKDLKTCKRCGNKMVEPNSQRLCSRNCWEGWALDRRSIYDLPR